MKYLQSTLYGYHSRHYYYSCSYWQQSRLTRYITSKVKSDFGGKHTPGNSGGSNDGWF